MRQQRLEKERNKGGMSGDPNRPYSRGRAYDPNRYGTAAEEDSAGASDAPENASSDLTDSE